MSINIDCIYFIEWFSRHEFARPSSKISICRHGLPCPYEIKYTLNPWDLFDSEDHCNMLCNILLLDNMAHYRSLFSWELPSYREYNPKAIDYILSIIGDMSERRRRYEQAMIAREIGASVCVS